MPALLSQDAAMHLQSVVHSGATHDLGSGQSDRGASVIWIAIVHRAQLGLDRAEEAHRTRLLVDIEPVAFQCGSSHPTTGDPDSVDLSMGGGVQCLPDAVVLSSDEVAQGINDDRSEGGIAASCSEFRLAIAKRTKCSAAWSSLDSDGFGFMIGPPRTMILKQELTLFTRLRGRLILGSPHAEP